VSAQRIEKPRSLTRKLLSHPVTLQLGLVLDRTNRDETLPRSHGGFADSRRIGRIILVASHIRLYMCRRDQPHLVTDLNQQSTPMAPDAQASIAIKQGANRPKNSNRAERRTFLVITASPRISTART